MRLTKINGEYELILPDHRADREQWKMENGGWEAARINEMLEVLTPLDTLFDIGSEESDITGVLVKESGCDVVLFEPNDRVWPCIKQIWKANNLKAPLDFYRGFLSEHRTTKPYTINNSFDDVPDEMMSDHGFKQLYENYPDVPQMSLDRYCELTRIYPTVITMDVEGAEGCVLRGAEKTLREKKPIIFMSLHPEFLYIHYQEWTTPLLRFVDELGYTHRVIEYDYHECHVRFDPK